MNKADVYVTTVIISLMVICLIIGIFRELDKAPSGQKKYTKQQVTTYHLSVEKLTIKKVGNEENKID